MTPVWVERPAQKEEGRWKPDTNGFEARPSGRGVGRDAIFNHVIDLQLRIMERLGDMTGVTRSENLRIPLVEDSREI